MKIIIPNEPNLKLNLPPQIEVVVIDEDQPVPPCHQDAEVCVLWGMTPPVAQFVKQLPQVRWYQTLSAGPDGLLHAELPKGTIITNGIHFHDQTVAEHALALTLALARQLPAALDYQRQQIWSNLGGNQPLHPEDRVTTLLDSKVTVWGFGAIGQQVARVCQAFGAQVRGVARSAGQRAGFPVFAADQLDQLLGDTDVLIMVLPASKATEQALNAQVLQALPNRALVVNVGRGSTVDQAALITALESGQIAGAALDVTPVEPLPADSALWQAPNLIITPHAAGGRPYRASERFEHNLAAWQAGDYDSMIGIIKRA